MNAIIYVLIGFFVFIIAGYIYFVVWQNLKRRAIYFASWKLARKIIKEQRKKGIEPANELIEMRKLSWKLMFAKSNEL